MTRKSIHLKDGESQSLFQQKVLCNKKLTKVQYVLSNCHNPYFSRRFFAIKLTKREANEYVCHNPYFSRRFFAIGKQVYAYFPFFISHNPYFSRRFFAICGTWFNCAGRTESQSLFQQKVLCNYNYQLIHYFIVLVTILILVEGSLQLDQNLTVVPIKVRHNPYFSRRFFAIGYEQEDICKLVESQSLFQQKVLCNLREETEEANTIVSQSLFQQKVLCNVKRVTKGSSVLSSQSLFQQKVLCNRRKKGKALSLGGSQSLFQQKVLCNWI